MKGTRWVGVVAVIVLFLGCGKSKLAPFLPDAPDGWSAEGSATNKDVSGVGHSSMRSYAPSGSAGSLGVQRVTVQILQGEKDADQKKLQEMAGPRKFEFKESKQVGGFPAFESFPLPDNDTHSLDIIPKKGTYVLITAYKGGAGWGKSENRQAAVSAFAGKVDLKKLAALE